MADWLLIMAIIGFLMVCWVVFVMAVALMLVLEELIGRRFL